MDTYSGHVNVLVLSKDCFHRPQCIPANKNSAQVEHFT